MFHHNTRFIINTKLLCFMFNFSRNASIWFMNWTNNFLNILRPQIGSTRRQTRVRALIGERTAANEPQWMKQPRYLCRMEMTRELQRVSHRVLCRVKRGSLKRARRAVSPLALRSDSQHVCPRRDGITLNNVITASICLSALATGVSRERAAFDVRHSDHMWPRRRPIGCEIMASLAAVRGRRFHEALGALLGYTIWLL